VPLFFSVVSVMRSSLRRAGDHDNGTMAIIRWDRATLVA
jgi:hypothetical protein